MRSGKDRFAQVQVAVVLAALGGLTACGGAPEKAPVTAYTPAFTFAMPGGAAPAKTEISFALVRPAWKVQATASGKVFAKSLATDVEKLLIHRGFSVAGPYDTLDEMTFPQKKQADLVLTPEISVDVICPQVQGVAEQVGNAFTGLHMGIAYHVKGACKAQGKIIFQIIEPLSAQKVWLKTVELEGVEEDCTADGTGEEVKMALDNAGAHVLEKMYPAVMRKAAAYFVTEEMALVKKQSQELREKKVY